MAGISYTERKNNIVMFYHLGDEDVIKEISPAFLPKIGDVLEFSEGGCLGISEIEYEVTHIKRHASFQYHEITYWHMDIYMVKKSEVEKAEKENID